MTEIERLKDELLTLTCERMALQETREDMLGCKDTERNFDVGMRILEAKIELFKAKIAIAMIPTKKKFWLW